MYVIGVALRASTKRQSSLVCLVGEKGGKPSVLWLDTFIEDEGLLKMVRLYPPEVLAIGSPLSLPLGLHCLDPECPCVPVSQERGREAEQQLAQVGIRLFFTVKGSVIRTLIYRGRELGNQPREQGVRVIEVSPPASKVLLFGDNTPIMTSPESVPFLRNALGKRIEGLQPYYRRIDKPMCQALLSALTAWLYANGKTEELGSEEEGRITIPRKLVRILQ